jgi:hypothetical protein
VEAVVWKRKAEVDARSLLERFAVVGAPDYTRFRNRVRVSPLGSTAPYIGLEVFVDRGGLRSLRYSAVAARSQRT